VTDTTEAADGAHERLHNDKLPNPFSDPSQENEIIQLQELKTLGGIKSTAGDVFPEHPPWISSHPSQTHASHGLKPILQDDDNTSSQLDPTAADEGAIFPSSSRLQRRVKNARLEFLIHNSAAHARQAAVEHHRASGALTPTRVIDNMAQHDSRRLRVPSRSQQYKFPPEGEASRFVSKKRPATVGFDRNMPIDVMTCYSKSSSRASNDPFTFDGEDYSLFLKSSAHKEERGPVCPADANVSCAPERGPRANMHTQFQPGSFYDSAAVQSA
jgi:hypothetical protein